jgi:hypothetical protein
MKNRINKIGATLTILTFGLICGIGGYELRSSTDSATSPLPIAKGGTSAKSAADARTNLGMTTSVSESSTDNEFPSSRAVFSYGSPEAWKTVSGKYLNIKYKKYMRLLFVEVTSTTLKANLASGDQNNDITLPEEYRSNNYSCGGLISMGGGALYARIWVTGNGIVRVSSNQSSTISASWVLPTLFICSLS